MNPAGIGVDTIDISRVRRIVNGKYGRHFLNNNFTKRELDYINRKSDSINHVATTFAAKEAVFKALGTGWTERNKIEIIRERNGKPRAIIKNSDKNVLLSLSYDNKSAVAFAVIND